MTRPIPPREQFRQVMERTLVLTGQRVPRKSVQKLAKIFKSLCWEFPDYQIIAYTVLDDDGNFGYTPSRNGETDARILMNAEQLHKVVYERGNLPKMFLTGKVKIKGIPMFKLMKFVPLLGPFLESYKQACEELGDNESP